MMETIKGRNIFLKKQKRRPPFQAGNSDCLGKGTNLGGATMDFFGNDMVALDSPQRWRVVVVIVSKGNAWVTKICVTQPSSAGKTKQAWCDWHPKEWLRTVSWVIARVPYFRCFTDYHRKMTPRKIFLKSVYTETPEFLFFLQKLYLCKSSRRFRLTLSWHTSYKNSVGGRA